MIKPFNYVFLAITDRFRLVLLGNEQFVKFWTEENFWSFSRLLLKTYGVGVCDADRPAGGKFFKFDLFNCILKSTLKTIFSPSFFFLLSPFFSFCSGPRGLQLYSVHPPADGIPVMDSTLGITYWFWLANESAVMQSTKLNKDVNLWTNWYAMINAVVNYNKA